MPIKLMIEMSDRHKREFIANKAEWDVNISYLVTEIITREDLLEYKEKLRIESILKLCRTGK